MNLKTYEITFECRNGDWRYWHIKVQDFQAACENAMMSVPTFKNDKVMNGARLIRIEHIPERDNVIDLLDALRRTENPEA